VFAQKPAGKVTEKPAAAAAGTAQPNVGVLDADTVLVKEFEGVGPGRDAEGGAT